MVKFVNSEEEITTLEARKKYRGYYIGFVDSKPIDPKEIFDKRLAEYYIPPTHMTNNIKYPRKPRTENKYRFYTAGV